ncbi:MAG: FtsX-like permease family protein [Chloroflexi bacterium]|nr:FtsX-like permease family protein [Chloroflexota bacterium]
MNELFGIPMTSIMIVLVVLFAVCVVGVASIWLSNRVMFRLGLRNIPRRGTQTVLVVVGLMLATLIITAAFTTGDTFNYSITSTAYNTLQRIDMGVSFTGAGNGVVTYPSQDVVKTVEAKFQGDPDIEGFNAYLTEKLPVLNPRTRLSEPAVTLVGMDPQRQAALGGLQLANGGSADLNALRDNQAYVSKRLADKLDVRKGDTITVFGANNARIPVQVLDIVEDEVASGSDGFGGPNAAGGLSVPLATAQSITNQPGQINLLTVSLKGDVRSSAGRTDAAFPRFESYMHSAEGRQALGLGDQNVKVEKLKQDAVNLANLLASVFTTFFLVLGLFSIAAGIMLIFMIFVMLAAERRTEMGMARAIGAKRTNLVQMFVSEGMAYNIMAGAVGAALGVLVSFGLIVGGSKLVFGDELSFIQGHVTLRSLVVSYCLGAVVTFITVVVSSMRVSRLNIVAAVRGTDDIHPHDSKRGHSWKWIVLGVLLIWFIPLGPYLLLRKGIGLPSGWVWGPMGIIVGVLAIVSAKSADSQFLFSLGMSLIPLSAAGIARYYRADRRLTWTVVGGLLAFYWLTPIKFDKILLGTNLSGNIEMFVLSGIMVVTALTLLIVFNARLLANMFEISGHGLAAYRPAIVQAFAAAVSVLIAVILGDNGDGLGQLFYLLAGLLVFTTLLSAAAGRFPRLAPALKMAIAYPLANRFRTGMTIAMFSLIVFSLTTFSIINANFVDLFAGDEAKGGWDILATANRANPVNDLRAALQTEGSLNVNQITAIGRASSQELGSQEARQVVTSPDKTPDWETYPIRAADQGFFLNNQAKLDGRAPGYATDQAVYQAVQSGMNLGIMERAPLQAGDFGGGSDFKVKGVKITDGAFPAFDVEVRDPITGKSGAVTIIGVLSSKIQPTLMNGIFTNVATYTPVFGTPRYLLDYVRLAPGVNSKAAAKSIKAALVTQGVQATSIQEQIDNDQAQNKGFTRIFQAFMALGLFVGIAALGVIAFRSVVERRQQIGMLRAIGYQRGTVSLTFLLESSFIAIMGIGSGIIGAAILSRNLMTSDSFTNGTTGLKFFIPWTEVVAFVVAAYLFALLMTWWPSRGAAKVPIAEALRYE